jgi:hypothetical protein
MPPARRADLLAWSRQGVPIREIAARLTEAGHPVLKDSVHRHLRSCVDPDAAADLRSEDAAMIMAVIVRDAINCRFGGLADSIAVRLAEHGMTREATVIQAATVEMMRTALSEVPECEPARRLAESAEFAVCVNRVLSRPAPFHVSVARELSDEFRVIGDADMADALLAVAQRATRTQDDPAGDGGAPRPVASPAGPQSTREKETA